jgi:hypothetical protein
MARGSGCTAIAQAQPRDVATRTLGPATTTALDFLYGDSFRSFVESFDGGRLTAVVGHDSNDSFTDKYRTDSRSDLSAPREIEGFYNRETGEVHLRPRVVETIARAERGAASPWEIYKSAVLLAHELLHAASGVKVGAEHDQTNSETIEEGATEALARLHADQLARGMGLWREESGLRLAAPTYKTGIYPNEVEAMVATAAACVGELDLAKLREGSYRQPEVLSAGARAFLTELHTKTARPERPLVIARQLHKLYGGAQEQTQTMLEELYQKLDDSDAYGYGHGWQFQPDEDGEGEFYETYTDQDYSDDLAATFTHVLAGEAVIAGLELPAVECGELLNLAALASACKSAADASELLDFYARLLDDFETMPSELAADIRSRRADTLRAFPELA